MFSQEDLKRRVARFQQLMKQNNIDASIIRTLSSFTYFSGLKWLRPALLIPAEGDPIVFIFKHEVEEFIDKSWIQTVKTYTRVEELIKAVSGTIREAGYRRVGFDYSVERDSYVLFFEFFKLLNPQVEIVDVHSLIMQLRMVKDSSEIEAIKKASSIAEIGMQKAIEVIEVGKTELEVAAEAMSEMMKRGAENPHIYIATGPRPRIHAEPRAWAKIKPKNVVEIVISADYEGYYSNLTRTVFLGGFSPEKKKAYEVFMEARRVAEENLKPGTKLIEIENLLRKFVEDKGYGDYYVTGFTHGVGLLTEEDPITTIVASHRQYKAVENMVLAFIHAPLTIPGVGTIKFEDTYVIRVDGPERLTKFEYEIVK